MLFDQKSLPQQAKPKISGPPKCKCGAKWAPYGIGPAAQPKTESMCAACFLAHPTNDDYRARMAESVRKSMED